MLTASHIYKNLVGSLILTDSLYELFCIAAYATESVSCYAPLRERQGASDRLICFLSISRAPFEIWSDRALALSLITVEQSEGSNTGGGGHYHREPEGISNGIQTESESLSSFLRLHQILTYNNSYSHFLMQFDTNSRVLKTLSSRLQADPRVIKWTTLKLGERLDQIVPKNTSRDAATTSNNISAQMGGGRTVFHKVD